MKKAWYVGSPNVFLSRGFSGVWAKDTLDEAIAHAKEMLRKEPDKQECFIVEVVKVVRRPEIAVEIEDVK